MSMLPSPQLLVGWEYVGVSPLLLRFKLYSGLDGFNGILLIIVNVLDDDGDDADIFCFLRLLRGLVINARDAISRQVCRNVGANG